MNINIQVDTSIFSHSPKTVRAGRTNGQNNPPQAVLLQSKTQPSNQLQLNSPIIQMSSDS